MSADILPILRNWPHDPDRVTVRIAQTDDGREVIQMRLDLGLLQMEFHGRPDGQRPHGCESWLEYYSQQAAAHAGEPFQLNSDDCTNLLREGVQYYHRYLSFWHLQRYDDCARDTKRNLELFAFVRRYAAAKRDKLMFDQWRPYVTSMHARSVATPQYNEGDFVGAVETIDAGIAGIWAFLEEHQQLERSHHCPELRELQKWRQKIIDDHGLDFPAAPESLSTLQGKLDAAVDNERFEEAAQLRDEIRRLNEVAGSQRHL